MLSFLKKPFPSFALGDTTYRMVILSGGVVFAILFFLKPFGLGQEPEASRFNISLSYGAVTTAVSACLLILWPVFFPSVFDERRWTVGKELLFFSFLLAVVAFCNTLLSMFLDNRSFSIDAFLTMTGYTVLVGMVPITISVLLKQQRLLQRYAAEAKRLNEDKKQIVKEHVNEISLDEKSRKYILLRGDNRNEVLEMGIKAFFAAEARDNYCNIYYEDAEGLQEILFRTSLKKLEEQLKEIPELWRCHKSFLVNLAKTEAVEGNAQGYRLQLYKGKLEVPVSRNLNEELKEKWVA